MKERRFYETLRTLRKEKGLTHEDMARKLNIKRQTYSYYEKEKGTSPNTETLITIARVLNCSVDYLLGISSVRDVAHEISWDLTEREEEVIGIYRGLPDLEQGIILGELRVMSRNRQQSSAALNEEPAS